jgi:hypothetical protein
MACAIFRTLDRQAIGFMCGEGVEYEPCRNCGINSGYYCDFPVGEGKTCDAPLCEVHAYEVGENIHYCKGHYELWKQFVNSGSLSEKLNNIEYSGAKLCGQCVDFFSCILVHGKPLVEVLNLVPKEKIDEFAERAACPDYIQKREKKKTDAKRIIRKN